MLAEDPAEIQRIIVSDDGGDFRYILQISFVFVVQVAKSNGNGEFQGWFMHEKFGLHFLNHIILCMVCPILFIHFSEKFFYNTGVNHPPDKTRKNKDMIIASLKTALNLYRHDRNSFRAIQRRGIEQDFSWTRPAQRYMELFGKMMQSER